ncbi:uncharacterized protein LOC123004997 isoform X2 [Tribolium madens]|uniref:uncharacterized protein LOC123004997 isoform X2 n=1 Tax=Tribolium madens TaxID=41895 RepID=UPI001CF75749|nr:uncharacterized protein LOC123004997 isoform X2 [Tribolium madens]
MELDEVLAILRKNTRSSTGTLNIFRECEPPITVEPTIIKPNVNEGYLFNLGKKIKPAVQNNIENASETVKINAQFLEKERSEVKILERELANLNAEFDAKKSKLELVKKQCQSHNEKLKRLQNLENCIKTYKLLTGTHFDYKISNTGYVKADNSLDFEVFNYSGSELSQEEIVGKLWALLENMVEK